MANTRTKHRLRDTCEESYYAANMLSEGPYFSLSPNEVVPCMDGAEFVLERDLDTLDQSSVDGAIHRVARGVFNWLTDAHPDQDRAGMPRYIHQKQDPDTCAIHGVAEGVLNWLTETHPDQDKASQPRFVVRPEQLRKTGGYGHRSQPPAEGHKSFAAGAGFALSRRDFSVRGNEISNSEGDIAFNFYIVKEGTDAGVSEFGNSHYGGSNGYRQRPLYDN